MTAVTARWLLVACSALLLFGIDAYAGGRYHRTKDGQIYVWNNYPRPGDEASWSGSRDANGYATGHGTLTWYKRGVFVSRYSGNIVKGKLDGFVTNVDASGRTFRGTFVNGIKSADWTEVTRENTQSTQSAPSGNSVPDTIEQLAGDYVPNENNPARIQINPDYTYTETYTTHPNNKLVGKITNLRREGFNVIFQGLTAPTRAFVFHPGHANEFFADELFSDDELTFAKVLLVTERAEGQEYADVILDEPQSTPASTPTAAPAKIPIAAAGNVPSATPEAKFAGKFDGTWKSTWSTVWSGNAKTRGTNLIVIRNGKTAEHIEESVITLDPGETWHFLPEPYDRISPIYRKKKSNSTDLVVDESKLAIRWPGTRVIDWSPKSIPSNVIQPRLDASMTVIYTFKNDQLIDDRGNLYQREHN